MLRNIAALVVAVIVACIPGAVGNLAGPGAWYEELDKPPLQPPGWMFGVVWPVLYLATGVALFLIWRSTAVDKKPAYILFGIHMVLNASWSLVFFGLQQPLFALGIIVALLVTIVVSIMYFTRISQWASWLFVPYAIWVTFATYLNLGVAWLN